MRASPRLRAYLRRLRKPPQSPPPQTPLPDNPYHPCFTANRSFGELVRPPPPAPPPSAPTPTPSPRRADRSKQLPLPQTNGGGDFLLLRARGPALFFRALSVSA